MGRRFIRTLLYVIPRFVLVMIFMFALVITVASNFDLFEPYLPPVYLSRATIRPAAPGILIGPYPHRDEMEKLKKEGVKVLVSLLDVSLPPERALLERERLNAARVGLEVRSYPFGYLPVDSAHNREMRRELKKWLETERRPVYIHCYLGRHRAVFAVSN
ncbi:MAG: hypothetical protein Fur0034_00320 [Desulfuromonadia bacterium]